MTQSDRFVNLGIVFLYNVLHLAIMNNKNFPNKQEPAKNVLRMQARASKGTNLVELGYYDGIEGKEAQYPHFLMYYMAWCNGHREYLLGESKPVA